MRLETPQIVRSAQVWVCETCGGKDHKSCSCNSTARIEELAAKKEAHRQAGREHMRRAREKDKQNQRSVDNQRGVERTNESDLEKMPTDAEVDAEEQVALYENALHMVTERMWQNTRQRFLATLRRRYRDV